MMIGEVVAGALLVDRRIDDVRRHRPRHVGERPERREIGGLQFRARRIDHRQLAVAVDARAAMARDVLDHRQHAGVEKPSAAARASVATRPGSVP